MISASWFSCTWVILSLQGQVGLQTCFQTKECSKGDELSFPWLQRIAAYVLVAESLFFLDGELAWNMLSYSSYMARNWPLLLVNSQPGRDPPSSGPQRTELCQQPLGHGGRSLPSQVFGWDPSPANILTADLWETMKQSSQLRHAQDSWLPETVI